MSDLIVALDVETVDEAIHLVQRLRGSGVRYYKIGLEAICGGWGLSFARHLRDADYRVMLDPKLHDIPETTRRATTRLLKLEPLFITVHANLQTMRASQAAIPAGCDTGVLGVTVLTSMTTDDLNADGYAPRYAPRDLVERRMHHAANVGISGVVCSPNELDLPSLGLRRVVPGIRSAGADANDQQRVATPASAVMAGANYLVVGRPIVRAENPAAAAASILREMTEAAPGHDPGHGAVR